MFFAVCIISLVVGVSLISLGQHLVRTVIDKDPKRKFQGFPNLPLIRVIQFLGLTLFILGLGVFKRDIWPWHTIMGKEENKLALLEYGSIAKGQTISAFFQLRGPDGWRLDYEFFAEDPCSHEVKAYVGSAQGPKKYYGHLSEGDAVTVIYWPERPEVNCEIRYFLNYPIYRNIFREAGKLPMLDKYKGKCVLEDFTFKEWSRQQHSKQD